MSFKLPTVENEKLPPMEVVSAPEKESPYQAAGSPTRCFLPSCRKPFESTCFHGDDGHYYCSQSCAHEGFDADLAVVEPIRKRS